MHYVQVKNRRLKLLLVKDVGQPMPYANDMQYEPLRNKTGHRPLLIVYNSPCSHPRHCRGGPSGRLEQVLYF